MRTRVWRQRKLKECRRVHSVIKSIDRRRNRDKTTQLTGFAAGASLACYSGPASVALVWSQFADDKNSTTAMKAYLKECILKLYGSLLVITNGGNASRHTN